MDDAQATELARTAQGGDLSGFRELVEAFSRSLTVTAYRYTWDWEAARDLCQDTWIRVYEKLSVFDPARSFTGWLYTIHRNLCLSYLRRPARNREEQLEGDDGRPRDWPDEGPGPDELWRSRAFTDRVRTALVHLSERQQRVFALVDLEQMDQQAAADFLKMNHTTLRTTLHQARRKLAELLRGSEVGP